MYKKSERRVKTRTVDIISQNTSNFNRKKMQFFMASIRIRPEAAAFSHLFTLVISESVGIILRHIIEPDCCKPASYVASAVEGDVIAARIDLVKA